ncbi:MULTISPECIES: SPW repeat protein [Halomonadaceae]|uniref:SPW repeat protein n=1 Tax=Halomonadaceae TaxID=28256 RepID=UPI0015994E96|nr:MULTISPECIES: SPW repeat protein [Halomonas]QJQ95831.1 SPW repeat protein [Halomonas sp. PA5]
MRFISTRTHGMVDYIVGLFLIVSPFLFGFADGTAAQWVPIVLGVAALIYSVCTKYELGLVPMIPMPMHLTLDVMSGILFVISPWLFGFADRVFLPHVIFGLFEIVAGLTTKTGPDVRRPSHHH